jgi:tRNA(fMet)-specific endonuclease VapC
LSLHVIDTGILSLYQHGDAAVVSRLDAHPPEDLAITVITVEEELAGWYALIRQARRPDELTSAYQRLAEAIPLLARWRILPMGDSAIVRYETLKRMKLNIRKMDLRIASIVLDHGAKLVTRNVRDFERVPGLVVENWVPST